MANIKLTIAAGLLAVALCLPAATAAANDHSKLRVPPGHLPPPGKCRIWYPGRPPGHQPAFGDCRILSRQLPRGAWLVSRDRVWQYDDRPDYHYHRPRAYYGKHDSRDDDGYRRGSHSGRSDARPREVHKSVQDVREARKDLRDDREQLQTNREELKKDRAELRKDIRSGASRNEIRQDRREIREDVQKVKESKKEVRQSETRLEAARQDLSEDLRRR